MGVAIGVFCEDETAVLLLIIGCFAVGTSPVYSWPSSPGAKVKVEQKPSEDVMSRVKPSVDLKQELVVLKKIRGHCLPSQIGESRTMKIANHTERSLLLRIVYQNRVLGGNRVDHSIWQRESH